MAISRDGRPRRRSPCINRCLRPGIEVVRGMVAAFVERAVPAGSDGQIHRAAQRLGLIAAAGELATVLELVPWQGGESRAAAAWALAQWVDGRGRTEPA